MPHVAARTASRDRDTGRYQSHRPEQTLLYQIVDEYYPAFAALMAEQGKELPGYVQREFEEGFPSHDVVKRRPVSARNTTHYRANWSSTAVAAALGGRKLLAADLSYSGERSPTNNR
jgi:hypothetical protein